MKWDTAYLDRGRVAVVRRSSSKFPSRRSVAVINTPSDSALTGVRLLAFIDLRASARDLNECAAVNRQDRPESDNRSSLPAYETCKLAVSVSDVLESRCYRLVRSGFSQGVRAGLRFAVNRWRLQRVFHAAMARTLPSLTTLSASSPR